MWRRFFHRQTTDADLEEELQAHLAIETKRLMDSGQLRATKPKAKLAASSAARLWSWNSPARRGDGPAWPAPGRTSDMPRAFCAASPPSPARRCSRWRWELPPPRRSSALPIRSSCAPCPTPMPNDSSGWGSVSPASTASSCLRPIMWPGAATTMYSSNSPPPRSVSATS